MKWIRVTHQKPCQICKKPDWCGYSSDGKVAICMRVEAVRQARNGGWVHLLTDEPLRRRDRFPPPPVQRSQQHKLFSVARYYEALCKQWGGWDVAEMCGWNIGVDWGAVERMAPVWDDSEGAFAWPMRNAEGEVVGLRLRGWKGGNWSIRGGSEGLFLPVKAEYPDGELVVCEGPTDTAAALSLGLPAVGRASCVGGVDLLRRYCNRHRISMITVVADKDELKKRPNGSEWRPGREGAQALGKALKRMWRMVTPPCKDMRDWYHQGCTPELFATVASAQPWSVVA